MSDFPSALPSFTDLNGSQTLATNNHSARHNKVHSELYALAAKVGADSSAVTTTHDYKLSGVTGADKAASLADVNQSFLDNQFVGVNITSGFTDFNTDTYYQSDGTWRITSSATANAAANKPDTTTSAGFLETKRLANGYPGLVAYGYVTQTYTDLQGNIYTRLISSSASPTPVTFGAWKKYYHSGNLTTVLSAVYPVGSIYIATVSTNPATLFGFGTWSAYGEGRVMVGKAPSGTFATAGATGGAETHTLTTTEMPSHGHGLSSNNQIHNNGTGYTHSAGNGSWNFSAMGIGGTDNAGSGGAHNNLQPYIVVYMWQRTA